MFADPKRSKRGNNSTFGLKGAFFSILGIDIDESIRLNHYGPEVKEKEQPVKQDPNTPNKQRPDSDIENADQQVIALKKASDEGTSLVEICEKEAQKKQEAKAA